MTGRVDGKMSFVTGAAQGLGEAIAYMLAKEGSKVVLADINEEKLNGVEKRINSDFPGKAHSVKLDVTSEDQWKETLNEAEKLMGGINILVNNAGIGGGSTVEETDYEIFKGKTLSDVFKDIYDNSKTNKQQLEVLMKEVVGFIKDGDTAVQIIPMLKEYLEINVKNDEQLVKLATVVQRIMASEKRVSDSGDNDFGLTEKEKEQLMDAIENDVQELQTKKDEIESSIKKGN